MNQRTPALRRRADNLERYDLVDKATPKLRRAPNRPCIPWRNDRLRTCEEGAAPEPSAAGEELNPGDRVESFGNFGKPTGEFGA